MCYVINRMLFDYMYGVSLFNDNTPLFHCYMYYNTDIINDTIPYIGHLEDIRRKRKIERPYIAVDNVCENGILFIRSHKSSTPEYMDISTYMKLPKRAQYYMFDVFTNSMHILADVYSESALKLMVRSKLYNSIYLPGGMIEYLCTFTSNPIDACYYSRKPYVRRWDYYSRCNISYYIELFRFE